MWRSYAVTSSFVILMTCGGCYPNRAVYDPWSYAPPSSSKNWTPPSGVKPMALSDSPPPDFPEQTDPFSLAELIDIALRNNPQTKITWEQARSAAASYGQVQSQFFPAISGDFFYKRARQPSFSTTTPGLDEISSGILNPFATTTLNNVTVIDQYYTIYGPELTATWLVWDFGTLRATSEAARQALYNADWTHNDSILVLLQMIMSDFYSYLYQKMLLVADVANIETARLTLQAAQVGFDSGVQNVSDVLQAKTKLLQNQTTWAAQQQNVEMSYTTLLNDMGLPANMKLQTQEMPATLPKNDIIPPLEAMIQVALYNRPDLLAAEANFKSKAESLKAAERQWLPQINYSFNLGKNFYNGGLHDKYNFINQFTVSMPLFQGFYYRNAIKIAKANKRAAEEQMKQTELEMIKQVTTFHYNVHVSFETLEFSSAYLKAAEEEYNVVLHQYKQGVTTIINVLSAQSSLIDARASLASAFQQWYTALANLAYSTGILSPTSLDPFKNLQEVDIAQDEIKHNEAIAHEKP